MVSRFIGAARVVWLGVIATCWTVPATADAAPKSEPLSIPPGKAGFTLLAEQATGIAFTNLLAQDRHLTNQILLNGSGVAAGDIDGDGRCDLYFCGLDNRNALYRNLGGWKFEDVTIAAGVDCPDLDATGAVLVDWDGDNDLDLVVNSVGSGTLLFQNDGHGKFRPGAVLNPKLGGMSSAFADIDGDGDLDMYITNYRTVTLRDQPNTKFTVRTVDGQPVVAAVDGRPVSDPELANRFNFNITMREGGGGTFGHEENGEPDLLLRNDGGGKFTALSFTNGAFLDEAGHPLTKPPFDWGLSVMLRDLNQDGFPDIYVCNDFRSPDRMWLNNGQGVFRAASTLALRQIALSSMGVDVADINRDGFDDLFVVDMLSRDHLRRHSQRTDIRPEALPLGAITNQPQYPRNMLYLNRGDGTYAEIAHLSGLEATEWSWTPIFLDVDLDGYEDILVCNGFERDGMNADILRRLESLKREKKRPALEQLRLRQIFPRLATPNLAFKNLRNLRFQDTSAEWGFNLSGVSQGMALADLDNDGDLDVVINNLNDPACLYRNEAGAPRVAVRLQGRAPNTQGIGARITLIGPQLRQSQEIISGGRYLSSDQPLRVFAAGASNMHLEVSWRSGGRTVIDSVQPNRLYVITEDDSSARGISPAVTNPPPLFADASALLNHRHSEEPFDDFALQPLLPKRLSQLGPGIAWFDWDGDGWEDLFIGSGAGGRLAAYGNQGGQGFARLSGRPWDQPVTRDQTGLVGWRKGQGDATILVGSANYEDGLTNGSAVREYDLREAKVLDRLPGQAASTGPVALADLDGDQDLDLFVGGRVVSGHYAEAAASLLFREEKGVWKLDQTNSARLQKVGLVSGAVWSDLDGDGDGDLILACEWGPVRVFRNEKGLLSEATKELGLEEYQGWWNGVNTGDFDGDGQMDIVASNWGRNTKYEHYGPTHLRLLCADIDGDRRLECIEGYVVQDRLWPIQSLHSVAMGLPLLRERISSYEQYGKLTLGDIYQFPFSLQLQVNWLDSTVFLNRGKRFTPVALPIEAQFAPAFAPCIGDFDGDGNEDIFLSQNFFATELETSRYDAGRGLVLRGDGRGSFGAVTAQESGVRIYGEQRGAALCDYDRDGRWDLAVAQNGARTVLLHNRGARAGVRVRLVGPPRNPGATGALLRLQSTGRLGPAREIHTGGGYLSQDGAVQVMTSPDRPAQLEVRWAGGKKTVTKLPLDARDLTVSYDGAVLSVR